MDTPIFPAPEARPVFGDTSVRASSTFSLHRSVRVPAFAPYRKHLEALEQENSGDDAVPEVTLLDKVLAQTAPELPIRFVKQPPKKRRRSAKPIRFEELYDGSIVALQEVPTRDRNVHDLFNALAWASFPLAKAKIHELQAGEQRARVADAPSRLPGVRTRVQDRLAMLDEGGLLVLCAPDYLPRLEEALEERSGVPLCALIAARIARPVLFGHAICEHISLGGGPLRCFALGLPTGTDTSLGAIDEVFAGAVPAVANGARGAGAAIPIAFEWFDNWPAHY